MDQNDQFEEESDLDLNELSGEITGPVSSARAQRFYDRLRDSIRAYLENKGSVAGKAGEYLLFVPDVFILLWRLINDPRVSAKHKVMLGTGLAYYLFPLDIIPEGLLGPIGYLDDLVFAVYLLNVLLIDTDPAILREHWSGGDDVLSTIRKVLAAADSLVGTEIAERFKKNMK
jgi:uncharacterized membrane protein YkvA (DUF1232 family)